MIVVIATTEDEVDGVRTRLGELGSHDARVAAPSAARRLVLAEVDDERTAERIAVALRREGKLAVTRPDGGPRLEAWTRHTRPITFGEQLSVCFAWSEHDRRDLSTLIELGPGGFGSGEHPSTRLVVEVLVERIRGGERILDVGCGSGVLGLCALGLGASASWPLTSRQTPSKQPGATPRSTAWTGDWRPRSLRSVTSSPPSTWCWRMWAGRHSSSTHQSSCSWSRRAGGWR